MPQTMVNPWASSLHWYLEFIVLNCNTNLIQNGFILVSTLEIYNEANLLDAPTEERHKQWLALGLISVFVSQVQNF